MRKIGWVVVASALVFAGAAGAQVTCGNSPPPPDYGPGYGQQTVSCGSPRHRLLRCPVPAF